MRFSSSLSLILYIFLLGILVLCSWENNNKKVHWMRILRHKRHDKLLCGLGLTFSCLNPSSKLVQLCMSANLSNVLWFCSRKKQGELFNKNNNYEEIKKIFSYVYNILWDYLTLSESFSSLFHHVKRKFFCDKTWMMCMWRKHSSCHFDQLNFFKKGLHITFNIHIFSTSRGRFLSSVDN